MKPISRPPFWGLMAEFERPHEILEASQRTYAAGYRKIDAYAPFPVHGLGPAIGFHKTNLPWVVFVGGLIGAVGGFGLQYYANIVDYPVNVGGRPLDYSIWPAFVPVTFEVTILVAGFATVLGMLAMNGLPTPYHPVFNVPRFELASGTHFFLTIESTDPLFDLERTRQFLQSLGAHGIYEVDH